MTAWRIRELTEDDLDGVVRMWDDANTGQELPGLSVAELVGTIREGHPGMVASVGDELVGMVIGQRAADRVWIQRVTIARQWRHQGIATQLLSALEKRLASAGVRRFSALLPQGDDGNADQLFEHASYRAWPDMTYVEKYSSVRPASSTLLERLGADYLPDDLWDRIGGMNDVKEIIERRVILPVQEAKLAASLGVRPPKAIILFGPPGTGKTSFARGVAARLEWPFVELFPSELSGTDGGAGEVREFFATVRLLDSCVVFIDEVEEVAGHRGAGAASHAITNELLKSIPNFRQDPDRLLVCATNDLAALDPAFHRPGRFDCIIPVGLPDEAARRAIWELYLPDDVTGIDLEPIVQGSTGFTPADIAQAAATAAHRAFERAVSGGNVGVVTADYLETLAETRPSTDPAALEAFETQCELRERW